jgi:hypothetical protein
VIEWIKATWSADALPHDLVRLATTVHDLLKALRLELKDVKDCVAQESAVGRGACTLDLSPFGSIVQSLINVRGDKSLTPLSEARRFNLFVPREIDLSDVVTEQLGSHVVRLPRYCTGVLGSGSIVTPLSDCHMGQQGQKNTGSSPRS